MKFTKKFFKSAKAAVLSSAILLGSICFQPAYADESTLFSCLNKELEKDKDSLKSFSAQELYDLANYLFDYYTCVNVEYNINGVRMSRRVNYFVRDLLDIRNDFDRVVALPLTTRDSFSLADEVMELRKCYKELKKIESSKYNEFEYRSKLINAWIHYRIILAILSYELRCYSNSDFRDSEAVCTCSTLAEVRLKVVKASEFLLKSFNDPNDKDNVVNIYSRGIFNEIKV